MKIDFFVVGDLASAIFYHLGAVMKIKIISLMMITFFMLAGLEGGTASAADNWQFVDARGTTGYYLDIDAISYENLTEGEGDKAVTRELINTRVAVVKAKQNRRFIYAIRFDPTKLTYQIFATRTEVYDTRAKITSTDTAQSVQSYSINSPMAEMVSFIAEYRRDVEHQKEISR